MTNWYVRSTTGNNANSGATWALAKATLAGVASVAAAGDTVWVSQAHAESALNTTIQPAFAGTTVNPIQVFCGDDSSEPPTSLATTGSVTETGTSTLNIALNIGATTYYGLTFTAGSGAGSSSINLGSGTLRELFDTCRFGLGGTGASGRINLNQTTLLNCTIAFGATTQQLTIGGVNNRIIGGGVILGSPTPTSGLVSAATGSSLVMEGFDMTGFSSSMSLINPAGSCQVLIRDCKLPNSWSGSLCFTTSSMNPQAVVEMVNCASNSVNYAYWRQMLTGSVRHETVIVLTGGASDGITPISWKLVTTASVKYPNTSLVTADMLVWNDTVGSSLTATVEVVTNNVTLTNEDCYLEVLYLGSSSFPLASKITNAKSSYTDTAANQTSSSATWTTTGLATPLKQKLQVTFTPQMKGFVVGRVHLTKPSTTVYVDPKMTVA